MPILDPKDRAMDNVAPEIIKEVRAINARIRERMMGLAEIRTGWRARIGRNTKMVRPVDEQSCQIEDIPTCYLDG